jgi:outer membrane biosynthesis protein TonB
MNRRFLVVLVALVASSTQLACATTAPPAAPLADTAGSINAKAIRTVVREHAEKIRYCYEHELNRNPGIAGKVIMQWVVNAEGKVISAQMESSSLNNENMHAWIAAS